MDFAVLTDERVKGKESKKIIKYLNLTRELKTQKHDGDSDTNCNWFAWNVHEGLEKDWRNKKSEDESR